MVVAVETLFLLALLSAFVGLIALLALGSRAARRSAKLRQTPVGAVVVATAAALASFLLYTGTPHETARQSVYGVRAGS